MGLGLWEGMGRMGRRDCTLKTTRPSAVLSFKSADFLRHSFLVFWFISANAIDFPRCLWTDAPVVVRHRPRVQRAHPQMPMVVIFPLIIQTYYLVRTVAFPRRLLRVVLRAIGSPRSLITCRSVHPAPSPSGKSRGLCKYLRTLDLLLFYWQREGGEANVARAPKNRFSPAQNSVAK